MLETSGRVEGNRSFRIQNCVSQNTAEKTRCQVWQHIQVKKWITDSHCQVASRSVTNVEPCWGLRRDWGPKLTSCRATTGGLARKPYQGGICIANINWLSDQRLNFCAWHSKFDMVHFFSLTCNKIGVCPSWFSNIDGVHFLARFYDLRQN